MEIKVLPEDIDQLDHVNNIVYLRWVQDLAIAHWTTEAPREDQEKLFWVVTRHEIDYKRSAKLGDEIIGRTWVGSAKRFSFERLSEIVRKSDNKILAKARTIWCPIDSKTKRPTDVSPAIWEYFSDGSELKKTQ